MSKETNIDEEVISTDSDDIEETTTSDKTKDGSGDNTDPSKSKKDFNIWKEYKKLKKENTLLKAMEDYEDEEIEEEPKVTPTSDTDEIKYEIFLLKNPEAEEYKEEIKEVQAKFPGVSYNDALAFSKVYNKKSESKKDFSTKSASPKKELWEYSKEEILATKDKKKLLEWSRLQKRL